MDKSDFEEMFKTLKGWFYGRWMGDVENLAAEVIARAWEYKWRVSGQELTRRDDLGLLFAIAGKLLIDLRRRANLTVPHGCLPNGSIDGSSRWREIWAGEAAERIIASFPSPEVGNWSKCVRLEKSGSAAEEFVEAHKIRSNEAFDFRHRWGWYKFGVEEDLEDAERLFLDSLGLAQTVGGRDGLLHQATSLNALGVIYRLNASQVDDVNARMRVPLVGCQWAKRAWMIRRELLGPHHRATIEAEINYTLILEKLTEDFSGIEAKLRKLLRHREEIFGPKSREALFVKTDVGKTVAKQKGRHLQAERLVMETLNLSREEFGDADPETLGRKLHLAQLYAFNWPDQNDGLSKAEPLFYGVHTMIGKSRWLRRLKHECEKDFQAAFQRPLR